MVERGTPVTRRSAIALGLASATLGLVGCRTGRNEIADAFARDRVRLLAVNVETTREAYATAVADLNQAATEMLELFDESDRDEAFVRARRATIRCRGRLTQLRNRLRQTETTGLALLEEWARETRAYDDASLKAKSREDLADFRARWEPLRIVLRDCVEPMVPLLTGLDDDVLALKHRRSSLSPSLTPPPRDRHASALAAVNARAAVVDGACVEFTSMLPRGEPAE
jgi:hypothetical protein